MVHLARSFGQYTGQNDFERVRSYFECADFAVVARGESSLCPVTYTQKLTHTHVQKAA